MKTEIQARTKDNSTMIICGNRHKLKLKSGEVINVITDKRDDDVLGPMWFVTHVESGLNIIPPKYYQYPRFIVRKEDDCDLDPITERNALKIAQYVWDTIYETQNKTFEQVWKNREENLDKKGMEKKSWKKD
jgi:hypothetical protein